jgi:hypothetical protein
MRSWQVKGLLLGLAVLLTTPITAAAQGTGTVGVGLSFLNDEDLSAIGFTVDYSRPIRSLAGNRTVGWVGDFSFHRDSEDDFGIDESVNIITVQGGVRLSGTFGQTENLRWHAQGLLGLLRFTSSVEDIDDVCDLFEDACGNRFVVTPGAGVDYSFTPQTALRAQVDFPLGDDISAVRFWIGISRGYGQ